MSRGGRSAIAVGLLIPVMAMAATSTAVAAKPASKAKKVRLISDDGSSATVQAASGTVVSPSYAGNGKTSPKALGPDDPTSAVGIGGGSAQETPIAPDRRTQITSGTTRPNSYVAHIVWTIAGKTAGCTGFLVGPDTLVTAAHCVHPGTSGSPFYDKTTYKIYPGRTGTTIPYSCPGGVTVGAQRLFTNSAWASGGGEQVDYGAIHLTCDVGRQTGWFGYTNTHGASTLNGLPAITQGYPGDKPFGTQWLANNCSTNTTTFVQCTIGATSPRQIFYKNDTAGGQSGSPVWRTITGCGRCAFGIHAYGLHGPSPHNSHNHGTRLNNNVVSFISFIRNGGYLGTN